MFDDRIFEVGCFENGCENYSSWPMEKMGNNAHEGCYHQIDGLKVDGWVFDEDTIDEGVANAHLVGQCPEHAQKAGA